MSVGFRTSAPTALASLLVLAGGCGRIGVELLSVDPAPSGGASGLGGGAGTGGEPAVLTGGVAGVAATPSGAGGTVVAGGAAGAAGNPVSAGGMGATGGVAGAGGAPPYQCTPGATEVCDGRDNNCDTQIDEGAACPQQCGGAEFGGHGYMLCDQRNHTWDEGRIACEAQGMHLAFLDSQAEHDFVYAWVFASATSWVWVGATDVVTEGEWLRYDGTLFWTGGPTGSAIDGAFSAWAPGDPDNDGPGSVGTAHCMALTPSDWQEDACGSFRRALCETY